MTSRNGIKALRSTSGFTLIELLLVIGVLGILAAMAIQQYSSYRMRGYDVIAETDLRNAGTAEEAVYIAGGVYKSCASAGACESTLPGFRPSAGVTLSMNAAGSTYVGTSTHVNGSKTWTFDVTDGRLIFSVP